MAMPGENERHEKNDQERQGVRVFSRTSLRRGLDPAISRRALLRKVGGGIVALAATRALPSAARATARELASQPNIILILTDDMRVDDLAFMPAVQSLLVEQGASFTNFAASSPGCAPARASILRGQYPHNHGILRGQGDIGGVDLFQSLGNENSTIATWLQEAGYHTALIGKYINGYGSTAALSHIPPGWSEWAGVTSEGYSRFEINENGSEVRYKSKDREEHSTDILAAKAVAFITETAPTGQPFFIHLSPRAPHGPAEPASRHLSAFPGATLPRTEAVNEADVSDKPKWVQLLPELGEAELAAIDGYYRARLQTLLAVDEMVAGIVAELERAGILENTYLLFTSDNGYSLGEHRVAQEKGSPYEEAIMVPLVVRGPGIAPGQTISALASQVDLAPTFAAWAAAAVPDFVDGRSLAPILGGEPVPPDWRQAILVEQFANNPGRTDKQPAFEALRTEHFTFVDYGSGEQELYDLVADPLQLQNLAATADPALMNALSQRAEAMKTCSGRSCRSIESEPLPTLPRRQ